MTDKNALAKKLAGIAKNFDERKNIEPKVGGKRISGGIRGGLAKINNGTKFEIHAEKNVPYAIINGSCIEPEEDRGAPVSCLYWMEDSQYSSASETFDQLLNDLGLLDCDVASCDGVSGVIDLIEQLKKEAPVFEFNTANRANKKGDFRVYIQGLAENQDALPPTETEDNSGEAGDEDFQPGESVIVNDPDDPDSPWEGEVDQVDGDIIHCIYQGDVYPVKREYVSRP